MTQLTRNQRRVTKALQFIDAYTRAHGYPPTFEDVGGIVGYTSKSACDAFVQRLKLAGHVTYVPNKARTLRLCRDVVVVVPKAPPTQDERSAAWAAFIAARPEYADAAQAGLL